MIAYLMDADTDDGVKEFTKQGPQCNIISYKHISRTVEDKVGNKVFATLRIVLFEDLDEGAILEIENIIYRIVAQMKSLTGSGSYDLQQIRN